MIYANGVAFEEWVCRGKLTTVATEMRRRGIPVLHEQNRPCPACGGENRFAVNTRKNVFICRASGAGGDAIALAQHLDGSSFLVAVEAVTGRPPPGRAAAESPLERQAREQRLAERQAALARKEAQDLVEEDKFREAERKRCHDLWRSARPIAGTAVEAYLARRGIAIFPTLRLRYLPDHRFWDKPAPNGTVIHRGPCMIAPILRRDGRFGGVHVTWLDLDRSDGKAEICDPRTGEILPAKKMRGSKRGGRVEIGESHNPSTLFLGEGIETVASVRQEMQRTGSAQFACAAFWCGLDLGNIAGRAKRGVAHPTLRITTKDGRERAQRVPGPEPAEGDAPPIPVPESVSQLVLLRDMDSEPVMTELAMRRAAARFAAARPDLLIVAWRPRDGLDFNDALREQAA